MTNDRELKKYLDALIARYEQPAFIDRDPVSLPHAFDDPEDQEIIGLFAAALAWGRRDTMLRKLADLLERMDHRPARFIHTLSPRSEQRLEGYKHRTFQPIDTVSLCRALHALVRHYGSIGRFVQTGWNSEAPHIGPAIQRLSDTLLTIVPDTPDRLRKHLARPSTGSACKRLSMYFRWMVRSGPVDLGLWDFISPTALLLPLDVHTGRQARRLGLLSRKQNDWKATLELTEACRKLDPADPARYDFALFGLGAHKGLSI